MKTYGLDILGISKVRWKRAGQIHQTTGELILYSGQMDDNAIHSEGVAIMIFREAQRTLIGLEPVSPRIITSRFRATAKRISLNIIQCYAPTNDADEDTKEEYYQLLEETIRKCNKKDKTLVMGDMNAKVGNDNTGFEEIMGKKRNGKNEREWRTVRKFLRIV